MNIDELIERMLMDVRLGIQRSPSEIRQLLKDYNLTSWDMPWVLDLFKERASKLTDADLLYKGESVSSDEFLDFATKEYHASIVATRKAAAKQPISSFINRLVSAIKICATLIASSTVVLLAIVFLLATVLFALYLIGFRD